MRKYKIEFLIFLLLIIWSAGCGRYIAPVIPPQGLIFTNIKAPLTTDLDYMPTGRQTTRFSQSSTYYFQFFLNLLINFSWGDASVENIAKMGNLKNIYYADYEYLNILGIYAKFTINVYGSKE